MNRHRWLLLLGALVLAAIVAGAAAAPAAAATSDPAAAATAYLQARGTAVTSADPAAELAPWLEPGSRLASEEYFIARGSARRAAQLGHVIDSVETAVSLKRVALDAAGLATTVTAHVVTTIRWHAASGVASTEASGIDHTLLLRLADDGWRVASDTYADVLVPAYLESVGVPVRRVRAAAVRLERTAARVAPVAVADRPARGAVCATRPLISRYVDILPYDREACRTYADKYALSYNTTFVRFGGADCANFGSQCGRAGGMPLAFGSADSGWWYDKQGTGATGDDGYSLSWINVGRQMSYWNTRRTDWAASISEVGKGDYVYYDWTGDGVWDHVAVLVGTNSAGQKVIDAHTTDHYRVYWKLGSSGTHYKFARTRPSWVIS